MQCFVYKGKRKEDHFLYLPQRIESEQIRKELPQPLLEMLGDLELVVDFDLDATRILPNAEASDVILALQERGYYFQMPREKMYQFEDRFLN